MPPSSPLYISFKNQCCILIGNDVMLCSNCTDINRDVQPNYISHPTRKYYGCFHEDNTPYYISTNHSSSLKSLPCSLMGRVDVVTIDKCIKGMGGGGTEIGFYSERNLLLLYIKIKFQINNNRTFNCFEWFQIRFLLGYCHNKEI